MKNRNTNTQSDLDQIQEIINRDLQWTQAHRDLDLDQIEEILSGEYQQIQLNGIRLNKEALLSSYRSGDRQWEIADSSDHRVKISGDLAILIGRWRGVGFNQGERFDFRTRFLSIYQLEEKNWKMILDISVPIPE